MWQLRTRFRGEHGSAALMVGLDDLTGLVQPYQSHDFNCTKHLIIPGFSLYIKPSTYRESTSKRIPHTERT